MGTSHIEFREAIQAEILRLLREEHKAHISRTRVEAIGEGLEGVGRDRAAREFLLLAGDVWAGEITPREGPAYWALGPTRDPHWWYAHFHVPWFQNRGLLPVPWE